MKLILTLIFTIIVCNIFSQKAHHQMISSQGSSSLTSSGLIVNQTIGQQSIAGSFSGNFLVQQGFQQSLWANYLTSSEKIHITTYPNPFTDLVNFNTTTIKSGKIVVQIFDINGKVIYIKEHFVENKLITINLSSLPIGMYLVKLKRKDFNHFSKIIKK
jgi:hypothetical protein|tara:strand:+ start:271 stop:747 length:477 start_codon:yes stop_codon:yes gene_type:complete